MNRERNVDIDSGHRYQAQWVGYLRYWRTFWLAFLGFIPIAVLSTFAARFLSLPDTALGIDLLFVGVVLWLPVFAYFSWRLTRWPCPHYRKPFHTSAVVFTGVFNVACRNCGITKYAGSDLDRGWSSRLWSREVAKGRTPQRSADDPKQ